MIPMPGTAYLLAAAFVAGAFSAYKVMDWKAEAEHTQQLEGALTALDSAHKQARQREQDLAATAASIAGQLIREKRNAKTETDRLAALVDAGELRLRDPGARDPAGDRGCPGDATAGAGRNHGTQTAELSAKAAEFLLALTGEADTVVRQLTACQALITSERTKK